MTFAHLRGVRVLDFGIITAGASAGAILADLGADVIKVEGPDYTDLFRQWTGRSTSEFWWNESPPFQATNRNKQSICIDLKSEAGLSVFMRLVKDSDVVLENFRAGVMERLGVGYAALHACNPRIILASLSSQGQTGPYANHVSLGSTLEASSGIAALMAYGPKEVPHVSGRAFNYPDQVVALFAPGAIMAGLLERDRTGRGAWLDISQREVAAFLLGEALLAESMGIPVEAPYPPRSRIEGIFKAGDGQWVAVTVEPDSEASAAALLGDRPSVEALASWLAILPAPDAALRLRCAGVAAEVVAKARGFEDPHAMNPVHAFGRDSDGRQVKGMPVRIGARDLAAFRPAEALGAQNEKIALELMKLSQGAYEQLVRDGVFSDRPNAGSN